MDNASPYQIPASLIDARLPNPGLRRSAHRVTAPLTSGL